MKLFNLNSPSITFRDKLITILLGYFFVFAWMQFVGHLLNWLYPPDPLMSYFSTTVHPPLLSAIS
jgi:hypothetical protein